MAEGVSEASHHLEGSNRTRTKRPKLDVNNPSSSQATGEAADHPVPRCSLKTCSSTIDPRTEKYVEIQVGIGERVLSALQKKCAVIWSRKGEAKFHTHCWSQLCKSARAKKSKNATISIPSEEKALVKEASKTAEFHDSTEQVQQEAARIAAMLRKARHCVVFTGAGISTSAGIGDYRGRGGKWTEVDREAVTSMVTSTLASQTSLDASSSTNEEDNEGVPYEDFRPTYTHEALVKLLELGLIKHIISQNGDGLHSLSGVPPDNLSELHGNVFLEICEKCDHRYYRSMYVMDDKASSHYEELSEYGTTSIAKPKYAKRCVQCGLSHRTGRRCEQTGCNGFLKDSIINFGDDLEEPILANATDHAQQSDLFVSLGTTMQVTPACNLVEMSQKPLRLVIINRQKTGFDELCYCKKTRGGECLGSRVFGNCDQVMRELMHLVMQPTDRERWEKEREARMKSYDQQRQNV